MNLSMRWLSDYIKTDMPVKEFCHKMTMTGSKVEAYETEGSEISKVVAAKILSVVPHENSDHRRRTAAGGISEKPAGGQGLSGGDRLRRHHRCRICRSGSL